MFRKTIVCVAAVLMSLSMLPAVSSAAQSVPAAGDESNLTLFIVLGIVAAAVVCVAVVMYLRSRKKAK